MSEDVRVIKLKNGIPTVISWDGRRYVLDLGTKNR
jgi:hypothetical protein